MKDKKKKPSINQKNTSIPQLGNEDTLIKQSDIRISQKPPTNSLNNNQNLKEENVNIEKKEVEIKYNPIIDTEKDILRTGNEKNNINNIEGELLQDQIKNNNSHIKEEEKTKKKLEIDNEEYIPNYIGKLCFEPLLLFIYDCKKKSFHAQKYENLLQDFEDLNDTSSCCNGDNKLFVSGGNKINGEIINKLWIFDLIEYNVEEPIEIPPKNNHSMIYIPKNYIFFIGGNEINTFYLDINEKKIENWDNLNKKRIEPALIQINNYLYVFDNVNKNEINNNFELTFEKTDLLSSQPKWELIKPELSKEVLGTQFIPKYFGVSKKSDNNIIFLGGTNSNENDNLDKVNNYEYNIQENLIDFSQVPFVNITLKEKKFLCYNNKNDIYLILPDFYFNCPKVVFYINNKNMIKVIDYKQNMKKKEKEIIDIYNNLNIREENNRFKNFDFNMPKYTNKIENEIIDY